MAQNLAPSRLVARDLGHRHGLGRRWDLRLLDDLPFPRSYGARLGLADVGVWLGLVLADQAAAARLVNLGDAGEAET